MIKKKEKLKNRLLPISDIGGISVLRLFPFFIVNKI